MMRALKVDFQQCLSCGICMHVCVPGAIGMTKVLLRIRGGFASLLHNDKRTGDVESIEQMVFPRLNRPEMCDACLECVKQCPPGILELDTSPAPELRPRVDLSKELAGCFTS
jgi:ferredoxin